MSSVFLDTNVWLPVVLSDGFSRRLMRVAEINGTIVISARLLNEVAEKMALKFRASWETIAQARALMEKSGRIFAETVVPYAASPDPKDALLLAQAVAARCEYFVTHDKPLLALSAMGSMKIISLKAFATLLGVE